MKEQTNLLDDEFEQVAGDESIPDDATVSDKPLKLSFDDIEKANREIDIVEVNLNTGDARVVMESDKPELTHEVLGTKGSPIQSTMIPYDDDKREILINNGVPLRLQLQRENIIGEYRNKDLKNPEVLAERDMKVKQLLLSQTLIDPVFSYQGQPPNPDTDISECYPIEKCPQVLLDDLWEGYQNVIAPLGDDWYQVKVLRGIPMDVLILVGKTLELYPVGGEEIRLDEMTQDNIEIFIERSDAERLVYVSSMIQSPDLSYNGEGNEGSYPIEKISDSLLNTLYNAHRIVNVGSARHSALQRFL